MTITPEKSFQLTTLKLDVSPGVAEAQCKMDDRHLLKDRFRSDGLPTDLQSRFIKPIQRIEKTVLGSLEPFKQMSELTLKQIKRSTRGKGDDKKETFRFTAYQPKGPVNNSFDSGDIFIDSLDGSVTKDVRQIEEALLEIFNREIVEPDDDGEESGFDEEDCDSDDFEGNEGDDE